MKTLSPNYELQQHSTCPEQNTVYSVILFILCVYLFFVFFILGAHSMLFGMKVHFLVSSFLLCFFFVPVLAFSFLFTAMHVKNLALCVWE